MEQRIPYPSSCVGCMVYDRITDYSLRVVAANPNDEAVEPLELLAHSEYPENNAILEGATYKSLAYIAHRMSLDKDMRQEWYEVARRVGLSQAHVSTIIARLNERDAFIQDAEALLTAA